MTFQDDLNRILADAYAVLAVHGVHCAMRSDLPGSSSMTCTCAEPGPLGLLAHDVPKPTITVTKSTGYLMASVDEQLDAGLITEVQASAQGWTPYIPPPIPWYRRLRWRWQAWREHVGLKFGGWIAGVDLSEGDDW